MAEEVGSARRDLVPAAFCPWARLVVDFAELKTGNHVLDVACGTGAVAHVAAEKVGERGAVVGVDLNPGMLAVARSIPAPPGATVEWRQADAGALPFADLDRCLHRASPRIDSGDRAIVRDVDPDASEPAPEPVRAA
jgi:SAM-dependent methyltransferase